MPESMYIAIPSSSEKNNGQEPAHIPSKAPTAGVIDVINEKNTGRSYIDGSPYIVLGASHHPEGFKIEGEHLHHHMGQPLPKGPGYPITDIAPDDITDYLSVGDINRDGITDLKIASLSNNAKSRNLYIMYGRAKGKSVCPVDDFHSSIISDPITIPSWEIGLNDAGKLVSYPRQPTEDEIEFRKSGSAWPSAIKLSDLENLNGYQIKFDSVADAVEVTDPEPQSSSAHRAEPAGWLKGPSDVGITGNLMLGAVAVNFAKKVYGWFTAEQKPKPAVVKAVAGKLADPEIAKRRFDTLDQFLAKSKLNASRLPHEVQQEYWVKIDSLEDNLRKLKVTKTVTSKALNTLSKEIRALANKIVETHRELATQPAHAREVGSNSLIQTGFEGPQVGYAYATLAAGKGHNTATIAAPPAFNSTSVAAPRL